MKSIEEMIEVMQAYNRGEKIEIFLNNEWVSYEHPKWNWEYVDYRIMQRCRAFKNVDEVWATIKKKGYVIRNKQEHRTCFLSVNNDFILVTNSDVQFIQDRDVSHVVSFSYLFKNYTFEDGTPCGVEYNPNTI